MTTRTHGISLMRRRARCSASRSSGVESVPRCLRASIPIMSTWCRSLRKLPPACSRSASPARLSREIESPTGPDRAQPPPKARPYRSDRRRFKRRRIEMIIEAGQVAVVTGAAQGLGRALTAGLIDRGVSVVLADIAADQLHSTAEEFTAEGSRVLPVITDVSDPASVNALASRTLDHFGRVDIVVNHAGIQSKSSYPL